MAKHYYNVEVVTGDVLDDEDIQELEATIRLSSGLPVVRVSTEYVDSEG